MDVEKLKTVIREQGIKNSDLAKALGIDESTFYRKMLNGSFSVAQANKMVEILGMDSKEANSIFFNGKLA